MASNEVFKRFKANTLKYLIKWISNPKDTRCMQLLEKNIKSDKLRDAPKRLTPPVQKQIASINELSSIKKEFMLKVLNHPSNLTNTQFINNLLNTIKPETKTKTKTNNNNNKNYNNHFKIESANKLIEAWATNECKLNELLQKISAFKLQLNTLNELRLDCNMTINNNVTAAIEKELNICTAQEKSYRFRHGTLIKIINKIKKLENKILQSKKTKTLQQIFEKLILNKNDCKTKHSLKLNALNQNHNQIKQQLFQMCSNTNGLNINELNSLKTQQNEIQNEKKNIRKSMHDIQIFIDGIQQILNEIIFNQSIDLNLWLNAAENAHKNKGNKSFVAAPAIFQRINTKTNIKKPVLPSIANTTHKKKPKFKRPTRLKAVKAKRITICDVLPKTLCPVKLSQTFLSNGTIRDDRESMFESPASKERENWINEYNLRHLPSIIHRYKSLFGENICFKVIPKDQQIFKSAKPIQTVSVAEILPNKKRKFNEINNNNNNISTHKRMRMDENTDNLYGDCINESSDDDGIRNNNSNNNVVLGIPSNDYNDNNTNNFLCIATKRNSKQIININAGKNRVFKPKHQKRYKVRTGMTNNGKSRTLRNDMEDIEKNHPLFQNDPLFKSQFETNDNCLHFMAKGMCGYVNEGKCRLDHPTQFDAKNFYCPSMRRFNECHRNACKFTHNLKDVPCEDYYNGHCDINDCAQSHAFSRQQFKEWKQTKVQRGEAWKKWQALQNERMGRKMNYARNGSMEERNDERLTSTTDQLFTSALTE